MRTRQMLASHPHPVSYQEALAACFECARCCTSCADACSGAELSKAMDSCIRTDLGCAATGKALSRQNQLNTDLLRALVEACRTSCRVFGQACRSDGEKHEHCRICGERCQQCEQACEKLLSAMG